MGKSAISAFPEDEDSAGPAGSFVANEVSGLQPPDFLWIWALLAGLVSGLGAGLGGEVTFGRFEPVLTRPANWDKISDFDKPDILSNLLRKETPRAETKNAATAYGLMGLLLGGTMGLVAGLARRSLKRAIFAKFVGGLAGALAGVGMSALLIPVFFRYLDPDTGMLLGLLIHAGIWVPIGAASGLAFGIGLGGRKAILLALLGGLAGAALGTLAFEIGNTLAFPTARLDKPIPDGRPSRLLGSFCVTIFAALGASLGVGERRAKAAPPPTRAV